MNFGMGAMKKRHVFATIGIEPLRRALKKFGNLQWLFNQLISVSAQYCRAIAKFIEILDNALIKMPQNPVHLIKGEQRWFCN